MIELIDEGQELVKNLFLVVKEEDDLSDLTRLHEIFDKLKQKVNGNATEQSENGKG